MMCRKIGIVMIVTGAALIGVCAVLAWTITEVAQLQERVEAMAGVVQGIERDTYTHEERWTVEVECGKLEGGR